MDLMMVLLNIGVIASVVGIVLPAVIYLVKNNTKSLSEDYEDRHKNNSIIFFAFAVCGLLVLLVFTLIIRADGEDIRYLRMLIGGATIFFAALGFLFLRKWKNSQDKEGVIEESGNETVPIVLDSEYYKKLGKKRLLIAGLFAVLAFVLKRIGYHGMSYEIGEIYFIIILLSAAIAFIFFVLGVVSLAKSRKS